MIHPLDLTRLERARDLMAAIESHYTAIVAEDDSRAVLTVAVLYLAVIVDEYLLTGSVARSLTHNKVKVVSGTSGGGAPGSGGAEGRSFSGGGEWRIGPDGQPEFWGGGGGAHVCRESSINTGRCAVCGVKL